MAQGVHWFHLDSFPSMENSLPQTHSTHGKVAFLWSPDSFSVISTASDCGYKLPVPTTIAQSVHWSIWIAFQPWKASFHWPQTPSTHGKVVFLWPPDSLFQSFPLHLTVATNFLCPLQWNIVSTDSIWIVFHPWKTPFHWSQTPSTQHHISMTVLNLLLIYFTVEVL